VTTPTDASAARNAVRNALEGRRDLLRKIARRGVRIEADEILQIAAVRALERAEQVRDPARAEAWVSRVVRNVLVDELRRKPRQAPALDVAELSAHDADADADCWCVLAQAQQLKPEYAQILRRVVIDMIPVTQVASELGLTPNNAMVRLHRARAALKARLHAHCGTTSVRACSDCGCAEQGCCPLP
jgi:RNA polymerase sigma-70 factor (ECF subfamily)